MNYQVVIPMTGVGQRFIDAGYPEIKPLIKVTDRTIIDHVLSMFSSATKVVCIISKDHVQKKDLADEILKIRPDANIVEIPQHKLGPGHAILSAKNEIDENLPTLVSYCDWAGVWQVEMMLKQLETFSGSILTYTGFHPHMIRSTKFAYVRKLNDQVIDIQEKNPYTDTPMHEEASSGCYGFATGLLMLNAIHEQIKNKDDLRGEYYISLTYKTLLKNGHKIGTVLMEKFSQWGTPEDLEDWIYWNDSINALPGNAREKIEANTLILAAGLGSRIAAVTGVSKPNILVAGQHLWEYSAPAGVIFESTRVITRPEIGISLRDDVELISLAKVTEGQAISAKIGLESINEVKPIPVNVLSSDNAFTPQIFSVAASEGLENDIVVWTSNIYPNSLLNPKQYAWINLKDKKVLKKDSPLNFENWHMITGNFTFRNCKTALSLIEELVEKNIRVNDEFYLDSLIELAFTRGLKVATINVDNFIAIGTPEEYLTYKYFRNP
jgi:bifunctional N-acetylglucosamine-1-phosphate-uridyltransferase/glucosamine-1-phosphate-acetyltransferase GlmU-like protein